MDKILIEAAHIIPMFCRLNMHRHHNTIIKPAEMHVLGFIKRSNDPVTPVKISEFFNVSKPFVTKVINSLEEGGYIYKVPSQTDNRSYQLMMTEKSDELFKEYFNEFIKTIEILKSQMGDDNFISFIEQLKTANKILIEEKKLNKIPFERMDFKL